MYFVMILVLVKKKIFLTELHYCEDQIHV